MKKYNPTTKSRRHMTTVNYSQLSTSSRHKKLTKKLRSHAGRNNQGRLTTRHQGGGNKKIYRIIDFKQDIFDIPAKVETIEYDPYRTAFISKIVYTNGRRSYILAPQGIKVGDTITTSEEAKIKTGNRLPLKKIPIGTKIHNIEMRRGSGGKLARSAGASVSVLAHDAGLTDIKLSSKEVRKVPWDGLATVGQLSNSEWALVNIGKAGRSRWLGIRPTVRGSAMNPVDHKYGGGEGRQRRGTKRPKDIYGNITGGVKTRNKKKWSKKMIVKRRPKKK